MEGVQVDERTREKRFGDEAAVVAAAAGVVVAGIGWNSRAVCQDSECYFDFEIVRTAVAVGIAVAVEIWAQGHLKT